MTFRPNKAERSATRVDIERGRCHGECDDCLVVGDARGLDHEGAVRARVDAFVEGGDGAASRRGRVGSVLEFASDTSSVSHAGTTGSDGVVAVSLNVSGDDDLNAACEKTSPCVSDACTVSVNERDATKNCCDKEEE